MTVPRILTFLLIGIAMLPGRGAPSALAAPGKIYAASMQDSMQYRGFSVARPSPPGWFLVPGEQSHTDAMFRRDIPGGGTYSAYVSVALRTLPRAVASEADFDQLARQDIIIDPKRLTLLAYHQKPIRVQGQWAIEYEATARDNAAPVAHGKPLILHQTGRVVLHPTFPNGVIVINDSERGSRKELSSGIQAEGRTILDGVRLESAPGRPLP